jgi:hypothetical protein
MKSSKSKITLDFDELFVEAEIKQEEDNFFKKFSNSIIIELEVNFGIYYPNFIEGNLIPERNTSSVQIKFSSNEVQNILDSQREIIFDLKKLYEAYKFCKETKELLNNTFYLETKIKTKIQKQLNDILLFIDYDKFKKSFVVFDSNPSPTLQYLPIINIIKYIEEEITPKYIDALNQWEINYIKLNMCIYKDF